MKCNKRLQRRYEVPSGILFLTKWSVVLFVIVSLGFFVWISCVVEEMSFVDRLIFYPGFCLGIVGSTGVRSLDIVALILKVFFFAALVSLFYEFFKSIIEQYRVKKVEMSIYNSFVWTSSRSSGSKIKYVPWYKPLDTLRAKFGYSDEEIFKACARSNRLRIANLASTRSFETYPHDRLVVECYYRNTEYGCRINRHSKVTIVVPSTNFGLSKFGFYLSLLGGFNFISKENLEIDTMERYSTVNDDKLRTVVGLKEFIDDANIMIPKKGQSWVIILKTMVFREGEKISIVHSKTKTDGYEKLCNSLPDKICDVAIERDGESFKVVKESILNSLAVNQSSDGFEMRISNQTLDWNPSRIQIIDELAAAICGAFGTGYNKTAKDLLTSAKKDWMFGYPEKMFIENENNN